MAKSNKNGKKQKDKNDVDKYLRDAAGLDTAREQLIGQHIGYRYDVNLLPDYGRLTPYLKAYMEFMGWDDLNWLEDVHMGYEAGQPAIFDRNINGWVRIPKDMDVAGQSTGPRHVGAGAACPLPDLAKPSIEGAEQSLPEVLSDGGIRTAETWRPAAFAGRWSVRRWVPCFGRCVSDNR